MLFVYHRPSMMKEHRYADDVAICEAESKEEAIKKFSRLYSNIDEYVDEVKFNSYGIYIATDY